MVQCVAYQDIRTYANTEANEGLDVEMQHHIADLLAHFFHRRINEPRTRGILNCYTEIQRYRNLPFRQSRCSFLLTGSVHVINAKVLYKIAHLGEVEERLKIRDI